MSVAPGVFVRRRGVFKYRVWVFWGVFMSGHVLVYLGICTCVWNYFCARRYFLVFGIVLMCLGMFAMFGCIWIHFRWLDQIWIHLDMCRCMLVHVYIYRYNV